MRVSHDIAQLEQLRSRPVLRAPESTVERRSHEVELLAARGRDTLERRLARASRETAELRASLRALSPGATLARGYAIAHLSGGLIIRDAAQAPDGTDVVVTVGRGSFGARSAGEVSEATSGDASDRA
jgi:exodeoxyribonuclease VII large subunit